MEPQIQTQHSIPLKINGRLVQVPENRLGEVIKQKLRQSQAVMKLFDEFEVSPQRLDELQFFVKELDNKYAETDGRKMVLNTFLFSDGDFLDKYFYIVAHEIVHWLSRVREQDAYFNDPEETLGFVASVAYELEHSKDLDVVWNRVYPKISWHFNDEKDAREFFQRMVEKAVKLLQK